MSSDDKCTLIIQAFTKEKVEVQTRNGNNLVDVFCIHNGEEKLVELKGTETITINRVLRRVPKDHVEV
tara:strand:+ start:323 stop:526 length:204 start_codon:yes stop_codon:yes gene_type:complete